ncbi:hypothetical protein H310_05321 [Aphanomyces invadans]|uniref:FYVE-type domain-containing protein n=1 Tax=Aphanomyces invadans TaxID=157072 RepID=A0A024U8V5_9STRA|nr:hypothetical protein H310_05321 [Aphanomyces invadans]ETW02841.1 hypothetical protein H310_05321 [Aphanomyces invadans]|eukprot:XP_008868225.1 hypothetical protein H310_05321 [Aphanomyces invadans]
MTRAQRDPTSFFDAAPLSPSECQMLSDIGKASFSKLLETTRFIRRLAEQEMGGDKHTYGSTISIAGSLEEIAHFCVRLVSSGDSPAHRKIAAELYCLESTARLHAIEMPTALSPFHYTGLRWSHIKSPMRMLLRDRDFCTIEYLDEYIDENGKRGFAMCSHSVPHASCPPLTHTNNYVRATVHHSGYVVTETDIPSVLRVTIYFDYGAPGKMAQTKLLQSLTKRRIRRMEEIHTLIGSGSTVNHQSVLQDNDTCAICSRGFKGGMALFQRKVVCRMCEQIVCKRCSSEDKPGGYTRGSERVCHSCLRDVHPAFGGGRFAPYEGSSAMSAIHSVSNQSYSHYDGLDSQRHANHHQSNIPNEHAAAQPLSAKGSLNFNRFHFPAAAKPTSTLTTMSSYDEYSRGSRTMSFDRRDSRVQTPSSEHRSIFRPPERNLSVENVLDPHQRTTTPRRLTSDAVGGYLTPRRREKNPAHGVFTPKPSLSTTATGSATFSAIQSARPIPQVVSFGESAAAAAGNRNHKSDSLCDLSYLNEVMVRGPGASSPLNTSTSAKSRKSNRSSNQSGHSTVSAKSNLSAAHSDVPPPQPPRQLSDLSYLSNYKQ